jgi:pyruvate dehydrogenase E1 component alpha subunit
MSSPTHSPADRRQILDADGHVRADAEVPGLDDEELRDLYRDMYFVREFDRRAVSLTRQGRMGSFPPVYGHEAAQVGSVHALDDDFVVPSYRDSGALIAYGLDPARILWYYMGMEAGNAIPEDVPAFPINGSVGSQLPHATGLAWADELDGGADRAYVCYFGDGATSEGDFHEALNFAGVFDTPTVFFCQNNQWAISVPRERQTASATIAQKAEAYGFEGVQVDGTDPLAVYEVTRRAVERAREPSSGEPRPTLVEAVLYRYGAHSTADDPSNYRDGVPEEWQRKDPVPRFESFLRSTGRLDDETADAVHDGVEQRIQDAVERAEAVEPPDPEEVFRWVYGNGRGRLDAQQEYLDGLIERHGEGALREG